MNRFTYKDENGNYQLDDEYVEQLGIDINGLVDITDYIGEKEDLEEQIGCPLEVVFKALTNGIYVKDLPSENLIKQLGLKLSSIETECYLSNKTMCVNVRDYKKSFWLRNDKSE